MLSILVLLLCAGARAHPAGADRLGHQLEVLLEPARIRVRYTAHVPTRVLLREVGPRRQMSPEEGAAFSRAKLDELAAGLALRVDGRPARWRRLPVQGPNGRGNAHAFEFRVDLEAPLAPGPHELRLTNANYPDRRSFFYADVEVAPGVELLGASVLQVEDAAVRHSRNGQWRMEEENRELELSVALHPGRAWRFLELLGGRGTEPVPAPEAWLPPPPAGWLRWPAGPRQVAVGLGLAALSIGISAGIAIRRSRARKT